MHVKRSMFGFVFLALAATVSFSQTNEKNAALADTGPIRASAAYAEILLRKTELQAELESLLPDYTEKNPKIIDLRLELSALNSSLERVFSVKPSESGKLTLALGKLIVRKAALDADLAHLLQSYNNDHPEVKRMRRKVDIFDAAINEVLH